MFIKQTEVVLENVALYEDAKRKADTFSTLAEAGGLVTSVGPLQSTLKALAKKGGVIQICFVSSFIKEEESNPEREKAMAELQEKYGDFSKIKDEEVRQKAREEFMEIYKKYPRPRASVEDMVDHIDYVKELIGVDYIGIGTDFDGGGGLEGCNDVSEMPNVTKELLKRGYTEEEIEKIWGGNLMRVFRRIIELSDSQE